MHQRFVNLTYEKTDAILEDIPGVEIKITKLLDSRNINRYNRDFLIMSTGVIYSRPAITNIPNHSKWLYLHDDSLTAKLSGDKVYLINSFRNACLQTTKQHILLYRHLFKQPDRNYRLIKKSINNFIEEMSHHYNKFGVNIFYGTEHFEPWI